MFTHKLLLFALMAIGMLAAYQLYAFWKGKINPHQSFKHFFLFLLLTMGSVFLLVFIFGFIIIQFKEFFFKV